MSFTDAQPLAPRASLRHRIVNLRRETRALRTGSGAGRWVTQGEQELQVLEAELARMERQPPEPLLVATRILAASPRIGEPATAPS